jgi:hypothetical protein
MSVNNKANGKGGRQTLQQNLAPSASKEINQAVEKEILKMKIIKDNCKWE